MKRATGALLLGLVTCHLTMTGQGIIIPQNGIVVQQNGNLVTTSHWTNNGTFVHNGGTLVFAGTTQSLLGSSQPLFNNITIMNGSFTTVTAAGQQMRGILLCNGTLNANDHLTLVSTAMQTALVDGSGTGNITGKLTMQRYLPKGFGYKYLSSPFTDATVSEFTDDLKLRDTLYPLYPSITFANFYRYDENRSLSGWVRYDAPDSLLRILQGYAGNFGTNLSPKTVDVTGSVKDGPCSRTLYNHDSIYTQGFSLIGNPYPSPVDWNAVSGWTKTNIDNALYFFDASDTNRYTGSYSSYVNGVSSNGIANGIIPSMQGVFIHVTDGSYPVTATLGMTNAVRVNHLSPVFHKSTFSGGPPLIRLAARYEGNHSPADPTVMYFTDSSSVEFNKDEDALKLMNTDDLVPNLFTVTPDSRKLSISALPLPEDSITVIPLGLKTKLKGWILFSLLDVEQMPFTHYIYFSDSTNNAMQDLSEKSEFRAYLGPGEYTGRFSLVISRSNLRFIPKNPDSFYAYSSGMRIYVFYPVPENEKCVLSVYNMLGQVILKKSITGIGYHVVDVTANDGYYLVSVCAANEVFYEKVYLTNQW